MSEHQREHEFWQQCPDVCRECKTECVRGDENEDCHRGFHKAYPAAGERYTELKEDTFDKRDKSPVFVQRINSAGGFYAPEVMNANHLRFYVGKIAWWARIYPPMNEPLPDEEIAGLTLQLKVAKLTAQICEAHTLNAIRDCDTAEAELAVMRDDIELMQNTFDMIDKHLKQHRNIEAESIIHSMVSALIPGGSAMNDRARAELAGKKEATAPEPMPECVRGFCDDTEIVANSGAIVEHEAQIRAHIVNVRKHYGEDT